MTEQEWYEIVTCLPKGRTLFYYFKDRYALELLQRLVGDGMPVREVKASHLAPLTSRGAVREALSRCGSGVLTPDRLLSQWPNRPTPYRLTLGRWPFKRQNDRYYHQTSRRGVNLVLQLNFTSGYNRAFDRLTGGDEREMFAFFGHPVRRKRDHTMAWARIDCDFAEDAALIEEVQTDWLRAMNGLRRKALHCLKESKRKRPCFRWWGQSLDASSALAYANNVIRVHGRTWDEAALWAAISFIRDELGLRRIYYHTWESGNRLKYLDDKNWGQPPRSLYTALPKRFCFQETHEAPEFLLKGRATRCKKAPLRRKEVPFYVLEL